MKHFFHRGFLIAAMFFVAVTYTGAYFSDSIMSSGNTFTAGVWAEPVINEVSSAGSEWIEIRNLRPVTMVLDGYSINDVYGASPGSKNLNGYSIPANGYLLLLKGATHDFTFDLNDSHDALELRKIGNLIGNIEWGDGIITAPISGESLARNVANNWVIDTTPTQGVANDV